MTIRTPTIRTLAAAAIVLAGAVAAQAATVYAVSIPYNQYGNLNQNVVDALGPGSAGANSCVPTAVTNSFVFLQNQYSANYGTSLVPGTAEATAENLAQNFMGTTNAAGTSGTNWIDGKYKYMESVAKGKTDYAAQVAAGLYGGTHGWVATGVNPTWQFLYDALKAKKDIELGILPNAGGTGHAITLSSFNWTDANDDGIIQQSENAKIDFIDPAAPGALSEVFIWQTSAGGVLNVSYGNGYTIALAISETMIPLPPAVYMGLVLFVAMAALTRMRRRRGASGFDASTRD